MRYSLLFGLLLFIGLFWCTETCVLGQNGSSPRDIEEYDIEVTYLSGNNQSRPCAIDSLVIFLEAYFNKDLIQIYINGEIHYEDIITNDESTGLADAVYIDDFNRIDNVGIRKNGGKMAFLETNNQCHPVGVRFDHVRKVLQVISYYKAPFYH
jgi:hypothetical protein